MFSFGTVTRTRYDAGHHLITPFICFMFQTKKKHKLQQTIQLDSASDRIYCILSTFITQNFDANFHIYN